MMWTQGRWIKNGETPTLVWRPTMFLRLTWGSLMIKDPITWILQMEQFFDLHNVPHTEKVQIASLYLQPNQFVWYRWLCSRKSLITWTIFTEEMIAHYEDTRSNTFFSQLINLKQKSSITEHIKIEYKGNRYSRSALDWCIHRNFKG